MYYMVITLKTSNLKILKLIVDKLIKPKKKNLSFQFGLYKNTHSLNIFSQYLNTELL